MTDAGEFGSEFDRSAADCDAALSSGLRYSGEGKIYFAAGRIDFLARRLRDLDADVGAVMDFGCGAGDSCQLLLDRTGARTVLGVDTSARLIDAAHRRHTTRRIRFSMLGDFEPQGQLDLVYSNGVFHHIAPSLRADSLRLIGRSLRPRGLFALWENNPWNPGTRLVMSRIPFDRDALPISAPRAWRMLDDCGFDVVSTHFLFIFPRALSWLRPMEALVSRLPIGAQYQVLCRKR